MEKGKRREGASTAPSSKAVERPARQGMTDSGSVKKSRPTTHSAASAPSHAPQGTASKRCGSGGSGGGGEGGKAAVISGTNSVATAPSTASAATAATAASASAAVREVGGGGGSPAEPEDAPLPPTAAAANIAGAAAAAARQAPVPSGRGGRGTGAVDGRRLWQRPGARLFGSLGSTSEDEEFEPAGRVGSTESVQQRERRKEQEARRAGLGESCVGSRKKTVQWCCSTTDDSRVCTPSASPRPEPEAEAEDFAGLLARIASAYEQQLAKLEGSRAETARLQKALEWLLQHGRCTKSMTMSQSPQETFTRSNGSMLDYAAAIKDSQPLDEPARRTGKLVTQRTFQDLLHILPAWKTEVDMIAFDEVLQSPKWVSGGPRLSFTTSSSRHFMKWDFEDKWKTLIAAPGSPKRAVWDLVGAALIMYDLHFIPMAVFNPPTNFFIVFMELFSLVYWTLNIGASLLVGYVKHGVTVMDPWQIFLHYLRTWFLVDLAVIVPDWMFLITVELQHSTAASKNAYENIQIVGLLRLIRITRLVRLFKLRRVMDHINELIDSELCAITFNIIQMIALLLTINHLIGCCWFFVGTHSGGEGEITWIKDYDIEDRRWTYHYWTSIHWAVTQFTPASMDVQPTNVPERCFAMFIVVFGLVGFSYIVGSITGSLSQLRCMHQERSKQFWNLRRFMRVHSVPVALSARIGKYLEHAWQHQNEHLTEKDVKIFSFLSEQLYSELQWAISFPHLKVHPLFVHIADSCIVTMHRLAHKALKHMRLIGGDSLFLTGERATHLYFVCKGKIVYRRQTTSQSIKHEVDCNDDWIAEPVLWLSGWTHLGRLSADSEVNLISVAPCQFGEVICGSFASFLLARAYAHSFVDWIHRQPADELSDVFRGSRVRSTIEGFLKTTE